MNIADINENVATSDEIPDPVTAAIEKYCSHPSAMLIKSHYENVEVFNFRRVSITEALEQVNNLDTKKASPIGSIPARIIKDNFDIVASHLLDLFNKRLDGNFFADRMKDGDVGALFKNVDSFHSSPL